jgi:DNA-binding HxlR family transcriptional regulator
MCRTYSQETIVWKGDDAVSARPQPDGPGAACPVQVTLAVIGGKWKPLILWHLRGATLRFGELRRRIPDITQKMLTSQLRELEADGIVERRVFAQVPPRVEYSLSEYGRTLGPTLEAMCEWGVRHARDVAARRPDDRRGAEVTAR